MPPAIPLNFLSAIISVILRRQFFSHNFIGNITAGSCADCGKLMGFLALPTTSDKVIKPMDIHIIIFTQPLRSGRI